MSATEEQISNPAETAETDPAGATPDATPAPVPDTTDPAGATPGAETEPEADAYSRALQAERRRAREAEKRLRVAEEEATAARAELEGERRRVQTVQAANELGLPSDVAAVFPAEMPVEARRAILDELAALVEKTIKQRLDAVLSNRVPEQPGTDPHHAANKPSASRNIPSYF